MKIKILVKCFFSIAVSLNVYAMDESNNTPLKMIKNNILMNGVQKTLIACALEQPIINISRLVATNTPILEYYKKNGVGGFWSTWQKTAWQYPAWCVRLSLMKSVPPYVKNHITESPLIYPGITAIPLGLTELLATAQKRLAVKELTGGTPNTKTIPYEEIKRVINLNFQDKRAFIKDLFRGGATDLRGNLYSWGVFLYGLEWYERSLSAFIERPLNTFECGLVGGASGLSCSVILTSYNYIVANLQKANPEANLGSDIKNFKSLIAKSGWRPYLTVMVISMMRSFFGGASTKIVLGGKDKVITAPTVE